MSEDFIHTGPEQNKNIRGKISIDNFPEDKKDFLYFFSKELKTARNFVISISFFSILYAGYDIKIEALFGTKIIDKSENLPTILFLLIFFQTILFILLYTRDLIKYKTSDVEFEIKSISDKIILEQKLQQHLNKTEAEFQNTKDCSHDFDEETSCLEEQINLAENDYLMQKNQKFQKYFFYIFTDGIVPILLAFVASILLWENVELFQIVHKIYDLIGNWAFLFVGALIVLYFGINYFLSNKD